MSHDASAKTDIVWNGTHSFIVVERDGDGRLRVISASPEPNTALAIVDEKPSHRSVVLVKNMEIRIGRQKLAVLRCCQTEQW